MRHVTLSQVAQRAGVSLATASRVLNGSDRTPAEHIAVRVRSAADELGYVANAQAQALARARTGLVGLVVHDIADPYFSAIARGVQDVAHENGRQLLLAAASPGGDDVREAVAAFAAHRTEAVIIAGSAPLEIPEPLRLLAERYRSDGGRLVTVGRHWLDATGAVELDNTDSSERLVVTLAATGARRFAYLGGPTDLATAADRLTGYRRGIAATGAENAYETAQPFTSAGGRAGAEEILTHCPDAVSGLTILAANDVMALGALGALRDAGHAVPGPIRIAGCDDIPTLADISPALTTIRYPLERIGRETARIALDPDAEPRLLLRGDVVLRETT